MCVLHPILYPEEGRVRFCLLLENWMAGKAICDQKRLGAVSFLHKGWGRKGCWPTPSRGKPVSAHLTPPARVWGVWPSASERPRSFSAALCYLKAPLACVALNTLLMLKMKTL